MELTILQKHQLLSVFSIGLIEYSADSFGHFITQEQAESIAEKTKLVRLGLTEQTFLASLKQVFDMLYNDVIDDSEQLSKTKGCSELRADQIKLIQDMIGRNQTGMAICSCDIERVLQREPLTKAEGSE